MKKDVWLSIKGTQHVGDESDTVELMTGGNLFIKNGKTYITYKEDVDDESETTLLKIEGNERVTMSRMGRRRSHFIIEKGKRHLCHYGTDFGDLTIGVFSQKITSSLGEGGGDLYFKYTIDINSAIASENEVFINVKECKRSCPTL